MEILEARLPQLVLPLVLTLHLLHPRNMSRTFSSTPVCWFEGPDRRLLRLKSLPTHLLSTFASCQLDVEKSFHRPRGSPAFLITDSPSHKSHSRVEESRYPEIASLATAVLETRSSRRAGGAAPTLVPSPGSGVRLQWRAWQQCRVVTA
ncbi:hypothetical protein IWZ00DRAFT_118232 [Phyllosticta capitalensis]